jgi:CRP-like cAMP-binding protein
VAKRNDAAALANRPPPSQNLNRLLAALPPGEYERLRPALVVVSLKLKTILHTPGEPIEHVYFPDAGFCSILTVLKGGDMVEVATIGREGAVGVAAVVSDNPVASITMVQGETNGCSMMTADAFRREMERRGRFYDLMTRYTYALMGFVMQSTACNATHSVEQRLARWLLMAHDRMGGHDFPLTQEFAAMMLGAARPTVTVVAGTLQRAGLIKYHRGKVTIVSRQRLESASCECYRTATNLLDAVTSNSR